MLFDLERVYLTDANGKSRVTPDPEDYRREATSPRDAIVSFVEAEGARVLGSITEHAGGAAAVAWRDGRLYSLHVDPVAD
jgi:hypothetical protein